MRISADEGIGIGENGSIRLFLGKNASGEVLKVHLMDNPDAWGNDAKGFEGLLAPFQKLIPFPVAFEFILHVEHEGLLRSVDIDLDGVIDDQIHGHEGFDDFGVLFQAGDGVAHGSQVDKERNPGEILKDDSGDGEGDFFRSRLGGIPAGQVFHIPRAGFEAVAMAEDGFEHDPKGDG